ncbi:tetratricopeptide (TPR) repeat protein [Bradyrhizobium sp. LM6.10]
MKKPVVRPTGRFRPILDSITYVQLAAALAKLGRLEEAKAAAARVLELHPTFRYSRQFSGVNCSPALASSLGGALRAAGLPE